MQYIHQKKMVMGIFDKIGKAFSSDYDDSEKKQYWKPVRTLENIEEMMLTSNEKIQIVFKHSTSCGVSFFAMKGLNIPEILESEQFDLNIIDVIRDRQVSLSFAERVNVKHESPQLFILKDGEVKWHGSHHLVSANNLMNAVVTNQ